MTREELRNRYKDRITYFGEAIRLQTRQINLFSLARLLVLVALIWLLALGMRDDKLLFYLLSLAMLILFLSLVSIFNKYKGHRELLRQLKLLNERELACLDHDFHDLPDGSEHADASHPWSHDLDLFGQGSLFQYLNRTFTLEGQRQLADLLTREPASAESIEQRQKIIADLKERIDFRQNFTATAHLVDEKPGDLEDISHWLETSTFISKYRWLFYLALGVSLLSLIIIIGGIFDTSRYWFLLYLFVLNMLVLSPFLLRTQQYQGIISKKHGLLEGYAGLLKQMALTSFTHPELQEKNLKARKGMREVAKLSKLLQIFDQRLSMLVGLILNGFFLFDFIMLHLLERWKKKNQKQWKKTSPR